MVTTGTSATYSLPMRTSLAVRLLAAIALGAPALLLLVKRVYPNAEISLALWRRQRLGRRGRAPDIALVSAYHAQLPAAHRTGAIDDRSWQDLDLDEVFHSLDHTRSEPGRQYLYHLLRTPHFDPEPLARLERAVIGLAADGDAMEQARASLALLDDPRAGQLVNLFFGELPPRPLLWWIFPTLTAGAVLCLALIAVWPRALIVWVAICAVNLGVQAFYKPRVKRFVPALHELPTFIRVAHALGTLEVPDLSAEIRCLRDGARRSSILRRATTWLMLEPGQTSELAASLYEYVNLLFLLDINAFVFATERLRASRMLLQRMFEAIGYVDAVQSISAWRSTLRQWSTPEFRSGRSVDVDDLVHPLLPEPVANSIHVTGASVLITGSNMSGKTTFVRAAGVSAVLSQTLHTACASAWKAPMLCVRTSIGRTDSILEGKSYYLAEVEAVRGLVRAKNDGRQYLFLLDELFRGTNTTERVAAAYAVLSYLNRGDDLVLVATHDLELLDLLGEQYEPCHFREQVVGGAMTFDYRIRPGASSTRNAIALLELMEYPEELVADAVATIGWLSARG